jgi:hypothetical protein
MRLRFPDTELLPHPVGLGDFKERHREPRYREKSRCSKRKESSLIAEKLRILKMFFFSFQKLRALKLEKIVGDEKEL